MKKKKKERNETLPNNILKTGIQQSFFSVDSHVCSIATVVLQLIIMIMVIEILLSLPAGTQAGIFCNSYTKYRY